MVASCPVTIFPLLVSLLSLYFCKPFLLTITPHLHSKQEIHTFPFFMSNTSLSLAQLLLGFTGLYSLVNVTLS